MSLVTMRRWRLALVAMVIGLAIGGGRGLAHQETPTADEPLLAHHPAHIHQGGCENPTPDPAHTLTEIGMDLEAGGQGPAIPVEIAATTIDAKLTDLLAGPYAIDVHEVRELGEETVVACGDIGGQPAGDLLAIGVREVDGSGFAGVAVLQASGEQTTVTLYLAHGLAGAPHETGEHEATTAQVTFHVPTITCSGCEARVEASLSKVPGILGVAFDGQDVTVTYDPSLVSPEEIKAGIEAGGDTVEQVGA